MKIKPMIYQTERKIELLHTDKYKNYKYYILNLGTYPTAYIAIPKGHKLYEKDYDDIYNICDIDVNGGLTYSRHELLSIDSENWFIGWDYAHAGDYMGYYAEGEFLAEETKKWTTEEIIKECENAIDKIIEFESEEIIEEEKKKSTLNDIRERYGLSRIEEKKIPEKLDYIHPDISCSYNESELLLRIEANKDKINKIIDYLDYLKSKGE